MKKNKKILIGFAVLISLLIILPFLIPVETYLRQAEKLASEKLHTKVSIGNGHIAFLPTVRLSIDEIKVGNDDEVIIEKVEIIPTISSIFSDNKTIDVKVTKPVIKKSALELLAVLTQDTADEKSASPVNLRRIYINGLTLIWPDMKLPVIDAEAAFINGTQLESAMLETNDGQLQVHVDPDGDHQKFEVKAKDWISPVSLPVHIDSATLSGVLKEDALDITNIDISLYRGRLTGNTLLTWSNKWKLNGKLDVKNLAVEKPSRLVSESVYLSGNLFGNGRFSATTKDAGALADNLQADFKFKVNDGVLHGLDLLKMASLLVKQNQQGDMTQFEELSGVLKTSGKQHHLRDLKVSSGLLAASGQVKVKPNDTLDGEVEVEVKNSVSLAAIPLVISGTVKNPTVYPSKSAIAGAVAGTALLGPGVGTSLGMKAGSALNRIKESFGSQNP